MLTRWYSAKMPPLYASNPLVAITEQLEHRI
jgi:hypothetical protein